MDWKDVGSLVSGAAPVLAGILGGPAGAVVGAAGAMVASFLGVEPEPEAVAKAVQDPATLIRLKELEIQQQDRLLAWREKQLEVEAAFEAELTNRHKADMGSDSWLSKNIRPIVLLILTLAIVAATVWAGIPEKKLEMLTDLGWGVFGYYFLGRSAFDKGAVKLHMGGSKNGV